MQSIQQVRLCHGKSSRKENIMGVIRKTLMVTTFGLVRGSSKKQRMAKKNLKVNKKILKQAELSNAIALGKLNNKE